MGNINTGDTAQASLQKKNLNLGGTPRFNQLITSLNASEKHRHSVKRTSLPVRLRIPLLPKKQTTIPLSLPVIEAYLDRPLDTKECWALANMRTIPPEELPMLHLMWRSNQWRLSLGQGRHLLLMNLFLGLKQPRSDKQAEAWGNFHNVVMSYLSQGEEWRSAMASDPSPKEEIERWNRKQNKKITTAMNAVMKAWRWGNVDSSPMQRPLNFTYNPEEHLAHSQGKVLLPREMIDDQWSDLRFNLLHMMFYLAKEAGLNPQKLRELSKQDGKKYYDSIAAAYSPEELNTVALFSQGALRNLEIIEALIPHTFQLNWSTLLELSTLAHEYNGEWAVAAMDWDGNINCTDARSDV